MLDIAPCPDALAYLRDLALRLHGRSGSGMNGVAPLSYATIADYTRLTGTTVTAWEVDALLRLDAILCHPEAR